jgi:hypothetical protein
MDVKSGSEEGFIYPHLSAKQKSCRQILMNLKERGADMAQNSWRFGTP